MRRLLIVAALAALPLVSGSATARAADPIDAATGADGLLLGSAPWVTVTSAELRPQFKRLARWWYHTGTRAAVVTLEDIRLHYEGVDDADRIRRFLKDAYDQHDTRWVLLGGDIEVVPARIAEPNSVFGPEHRFVSDLYYAALDGDWNADGDDHFGESADAPDLEPELWVGRAPVRDVAEARRFVDKTLFVARGFGDPSTRRWLGFASVFIPIGDLAVHLDPSLQAAAGPGVTVRKLYQNSAAWPDAAPLGPASLLDELTTGADVLLGMCAADAERVALGSYPDENFLTASEILAVPFSGRLAHAMLATGCVNGFDKPTSFGEALLRAAGGAVSCYAASELVFFGQSKLTLENYAARLAAGVGTIGEAAAAAQLPGAIEHPMKHLLLGDPMLPAPAVIPLALEVDHPVEAFPGAPIEVRVAAGGARLAGARVALARDDTGELLVATTDEAGVARLVVGAAGPYALTVTAAAATPYEGELDVTAALAVGPSDGAHLALGHAEPNPASRLVRFARSFPERLAGETFELAIYDVSGRRVRIVERGRAASAVAHAVWDLADRDGRPVRNGLYLARLAVGGEIVTRSVAVMR